MFQNIRLYLVIFLNFRGSEFHLAIFLKLEGLRSFISKLAVFLKLEQLRTFVCKLVSGFIKVREVRKFYFCS